MLSNVKKLLIADLMRLKKYNILQISTIFAVIYAVIIGFTSAAEATALVPLLVFIDATMMSIIMLGASLFFEKQEGSLKSVMVAPVKLWEVIASKVLSAVLLSLITAIIVGGAAILIHGAQINLALLAVYAFLGAMAHVMIGFVLVIWSKDFNALIINYILYVLIFTLPALFVLTGLIPSSWEFIIYISPAYIVELLLNTAAGQALSVWGLIGSIAYLVAISVVIFKFFVTKKFKQYVMRG
ncbi:MAG: ABC transporter permease [Spirochaetales bacterium]